MIDDYAQAMELVRKMEAHLPIPARSTGAFIRAMRERGVKVARDQELQIAGADEKNRAIGRAEGAVPFHGSPTQETAALNSQEPIKRG